MSTGVVASWARSVAWLRLLFVTYEMHALPPDSTSRVSCPIELPVHALQCSRQATETGGIRLMPQKSQAKTRKREREIAREMQQRA